MESARSDLRGDPVVPSGQSDGTRDQMCNRINELEAARDHLRARLREIRQEMLDYPHITAEFHSGDREPGTWAEGVARRKVDQWAADLLAVLTEPQQDEKRDVKNNEEKNLARVVTMGEGTDSRTASEDVAGSVEPMTSTQERHELLSLIALLQVLPLK